MVTLLSYATYVSSFAFLCYGISCLLSKKMNDEFVRYQLSKFRVLTGALQVLGAVGLIGGLTYRPVLLLSSGGLSLLMLLGLVVRIYIKDSILQTMPAFIFFVLNLFIFVGNLI